MAPRSAIRAPWHAVVGVPLIICAAAVAQYFMLLRFPPAGVLSVVCMVLSVLGAILGAAGIFTAKRLAARGLRSRDETVHAFETWQRRLPLLLCGQMLAVGTAFTAGSCSMMIWGFVSHDIRFGVIMAGFSCVTVLMVWVAVSGAWKEASPFRPSPMHVLGRRLGRTDAPHLWSMVDTVAARLGAPAVDYIVLGLLDGFFVTSGVIRVSHAGELSGHILYLSAAHIACLEEDELRGIIAHEMAHFSGNDLLYSERFAPIYHGFERRLVAMAEHEYNDWIGKVFLRPGRMVATYALYRFRATERHWSRLRELEADKAGAGLVGSGVFGNALTRAILVQAQLHHLLATTHKDPGNDDVVEALLRSFSVGPVPDLGTTRLAHPFDSHPALQERLDALGITFDDAYLLMCRQLAGEEKRASLAFPHWNAMTAALSSDFHEALREASERRP